MSVAQQIIELRRSGQSLKQIALALGCNYSYCGQVCRAEGLGGSIINQRLTEEQVAEYVSKSGFDYVGGYKSQRDLVTVMCRACGRTFERQFHIFRDFANGTFGSNCCCPYCIKAEQYERRTKREQQKERKRQQAEYDAWIKAVEQEQEKARLISRQMEERLAIRTCKNCGEKYCIGATGYDSDKYCSNKCMKRWNMRIKNDRRLKKIKSRKHDADITLEKLFARDGGICYLCGKECSWNEIDADGNAKDLYPSIDHVVPLSKGGTHTWNNVKLAHRGCNTAKGSAVISPW